MNSEIAASVKVIKVINQHLAEYPKCEHDIKTIMREVFEQEQKQKQRG